MDRGDDEICPHGFLGAQLGVAGDGDVFGLPGAARFQARSGPNGDRSSAGSDLGPESFNHRPGDGDVGHGEIGFLRLESGVGRFVISRLVAEAVVVTDDVTGDALVIVAADGADGADGDGAS